MSLLIHRAVIDDLQQLQQICIDAYTQNFAHHWKEGGLDWYIDQQFSPGALRQTIESLNSDYFIIYQDNYPVGFCKLSYGSDSEPSTPWLELEKIYLLPTQQGNCVGKVILELVVKLAQQQAKKERVLSVIDTNQVAIDFYRKNGFSFVKETTLNLPYFKEELKGVWLSRYNVLLKREVFVSSTIGSRSADKERMLRFRAGATVRPGSAHRLRAT